MSINNQTGNDTPENQSIPSDKLQQFFKDVTLEFLPYFSVDNVDYKQGLIDVQYCLLSNLKAQCEVFQAVSGAIKTTEEIQIQAGALYGTAESLLRQIAVLEVVTGGLSSVIADLDKQVQKSGGEA